MESRNALTHTVVALEVILIISLWLPIRYIGVNRRRSSDLRRESHEGRALRFQYSFFRQGTGSPTKYSLRDLDRTTDNFRWLLGLGGSLHGVLNDAMPVAALLLRPRRRALFSRLYDSAYLHRHDCCARLLDLDIKPENILLDG